VSNVDWYAARAAGVVAYALVTSGVLLGVLLSGRARLRHWPAFAVTDVHRFVGLLAGVFVAIHVAAVWLDSVVPFSLVQIVVPGLAGYRPLWVALGTISAELLVAVAVANVLRARIGFARWKRWHYLTFVLWATSTVHGIGAGTDASEAWLRLLYVASVASVAGAVAWRLGRGLTADTPARARG
jgi:methionine sulfoxide reductase heme-binding subunit